MKRHFLISRASLVLVGIALGYFARLVLGVPTEDKGMRRTIDREMSIPDADFIDLPLIQRDEPNG